MTARIEMQDTVRVIQYGVGVIGSSVIQLLSEKPWVKIVGAIDIDPVKIGRDVAVVAGLENEIGVKVVFPPEEVIGKVAADVVLHATTAFMDEAYGQILRAVTHRMNVITLAQELFYPIGSNAKRADRLGEQAKARGVSVLATGVNGGFVTDMLPVFMSGVCWEIDRVRVRRVIDFSHYGPTTMREIGAGLPRGEVERGMRQGGMGQVGLCESVAMIAACLGWELDEIEQTKEPIVSHSQREAPFVTIRPGTVCGFRQRVCGKKAGAALIVLDMIGVIESRPHEDDVDMGDYIMIEGKPNIEIMIPGQIAQRGALAAAASLVNLIPKVLIAPSGFLTMKDLTMPSLWSGT
jgi:hypothetical protein